MTADQQIQEEIISENPVETPEAAPEAEIEILADEPSETEQKEEKSFDPRTDKVDFSTPEQQEKFNYMYKQVKQSDARNQMLTDLLQEQQKQLDDLKNRNIQEDTANAEHLLTAKIKSARDIGDDVAEINATKELVDFLAEKKVQKVNARVTQDQQASTQLETKEAQYVESLMAERDTSGNLVRPWLDPQGPQFNNSINQLQQIAQKYIGDPYALQKSLSELDMMMTQKKEPPKTTPSGQTRAPNPMQGGNLTNQNSRGTIKMTRAELDIAKKLGVDPKKYAARRDSINKGSRK